MVSGRLDDGHSGPVPSDFDALAHFDAGDDVGGVLVQFSDGYPSHTDSVVQMRTTCGRSDVRQSATPDGENS